MLEHRGAAAITKEDFIADEDVSRPHLASSNFGDESLGGRKAAGGHRLEGLQHVADERASKVACDAFKRRAFFLEEAGDVPRDLVLVPEGIGGIIVKNATVPGDQRYLHVHTKNHGRRSRRLRVISQWTG